VRAAELSLAIQRVAQFADERYRRHPHAPRRQRAKISANSTESGESEDTIDTPYRANPSWWLQLRLHSRLP